MCHRVHRQDSQCAAPLPRQRGGRRAGGARRVLAAVQVRQPLQHLPCDRRQHVLRDRAFFCAHSAGHSPRLESAASQKCAGEIPSGSVRMEAYVLGMRAGGADGGAIGGRTASRPHAGARRRAGGRGQEMDVGDDRETANVPGGQVLSRRAPSQPHRRASRRPCTPAPALSARQRLTGMRCDGRAAAVIIQRAATRWLLPAHSSSSLACCSARESHSHKGRAQVQPQGN